MKSKISHMQLILLSTGGMLGAGWLFSPFYGYQTAGVGVLYSWAITAVITLIIGLSFAQMARALPIVGGIYRLMNLTHPKSIGSIFLILGWLSYVVYLPLEARAVVQYLGFWFPSLLRDVANQVELSQQGMLLATAIIIGITWFNTFVITKVTQVNGIVSIWKISIPLLVALSVIIGFGHAHALLQPQNRTHYSFENILLAVTSSGLAFAFSGFQNGLILANQVENPSKSLPYSLFVPILVGFILYSLLSLTYLVSLDNTHQLVLAGTAAPLLALLSLFGLNWLFVILLADAVIAPLGTTNVYIAVTSRILYSVGKEIWPNSALTKLNQHGSPVLALWLNAVIGIAFLFPFPTWRELMNFLSSVVVFAYLAGPTAILVLQKKNVRSFDNRHKLQYANLIGYLGFICCTWLIYWSGTKNLLYLTIMLFCIILGYVVFSLKTEAFKSIIRKNWYLFIYILSIFSVSFLREKELISFPLDNTIIAGIGLVFAHLFVKNSLTIETLEENFFQIEKEVALS
jgi:amino acid transporter